MAAERLATQLRLLSSGAVQRRGKARARNGQFTGNNLPALPSTGETEAGGTVLEARTGGRWQTDRRVCVVEKHGERIIFSGAKGSTPPPT